MKPLDIECSTCYSGKDMGCFDQARGDWFPDGIFHASRIHSCGYQTVTSLPQTIPYGINTINQPSLFPDDIPKQMTLSQRYGDMEIK